MSLFSAEKCRRAARRNFVERAALSRRNACAPGSTAGTPVDGAPDGAARAAEPLDGAGAGRGRRGLGRDARQARDAVDAVADRRAVGDGLARRVHRGRAPAGQGHEDRRSRGHAQLRAAAARHHGRQADRRPFARVRGLREVRPEERAGDGVGRPVGVGGRRHQVRCCPVAAPGSRRAPPLCLRGQSSHARTSYPR